MPNAQRVDEEIILLLKSRVPLIYTVTKEEPRFLSRLKENLLRAGKDTRIVLWSAANGAALGDPPEEIHDPLTLLNEFKKEAAQRSSLLILCDGHTLLTPDNYQFVRTLKETAWYLQTLKDANSGILLISPIMRSPVELEKEIMVVDYPLPDYREMEHNFDGLCKLLSSKRKEISVNLPNGTREIFLKANLGLTRAEAENCWAKAIARDKTISGESISLVLEHKKQILRKQNVEYFEPSAGLESVGGMDVLRAWIRKRQMTFSERARDFGIQPPRGILLTGMQGCGKSLFAKALAHELKMELFKFDLGRVMDRYVGGSENNLYQLFKTAEAVAPAIMWIDEFEKQMPSGGPEGDSGVSSRLQGMLLNWMQEREAQVFIVATANNIASMRPELVRKGRFDQIFLIDLPNQKERYDIFSIHLNLRHKTLDQFDLEELAANSKEFSGAEIESCINEALCRAFEMNREVTQEDLLLELKEIKPFGKVQHNRVKEIREAATAIGAIRASSPEITDNSTPDIPIMLDRFALPS